MNYPKKICRDCGLKYGRSIPMAHTVRDGVCDLCGEETKVGPPHDYGHLKEGWDKK